MSDYIHSNEFLRDFASGNEKAFRALHREYFAKLTTAADSIIRNYMEAEDIAIEALYRLMIGHGKFKYGTFTVDRLRNHLYLSVRNRCFNYLESFRRTTRAAERDAAETLTNICEESVEESIVYAEVIAQLKEVLEGLSEERRTALELVYYENKKVKDAAAQMAVPLSTFKHIRARAFQEISRKFPGKEMPLSLFILALSVSSVLTSVFVVFWGHY